MGSSQTTARTRVPCIGRQTLNHCATREAPGSLLSLTLANTIASDLVSLKCILIIGNIFLKLKFEHGPPWLRFFGGLQTHRILFTPFSETWTLLLLHLHLLPSSLTRHLLSTYLSRLYRVLLHFHAFVMLFLLPGCPSLPFPAPCHLEKSFMVSCFR